MPPTPPDPLAAALCDSPALFPHGFDPRSGAVTLVRLGEADLARASFLDDRLTAPGRALPWDQVAAAVQDLPERCHYIFHIGHVGSTLLSRLLGGHPRVLSLREPQILRVLAQMQEALGPEPVAARLPTLVKLLSRRFAPEQTVVIKATSYVSELAATLLARPYGPRALFVTVRPENFLATILGAENSPAEARMLAPSRSGRLQRRLGDGPWEVASLSIGEIVAMGWACEMTALTAAAESAGERVRWLDFDGVLAAPHEALERSFAHLGVEARASEIAAILAGPDMRRYSKAPEHPYDADLRARVLAQAHAIAGDEIARGLAWLERAAAAFPAIRAALDVTRP